MKAGPRGPGSSRPAATDTAPTQTPTMSAVPVAADVALRHRRCTSPLWRTSSGSVANPRAALMTTVYVTKARANAPKPLAPRVRATNNPTTKLLRLVMPWSATPQPRRATTRIKPCLPEASGTAGRSAEMVVTWGSRVLHWGPLLGPTRSKNWSLHRREGDRVGPRRVRIFRIVRSGCPPQSGRSLEAGRRPLRV